MPTPIPLFGFGQKGKSAVVTSQRHLNLYAEISPDPEKGIVFYGTPGLKYKFSFGETPSRGWIAVGDFFYVVHRDNFYEVNNAGIYTSRGTINTSVGRVDMAYDGSVILIVDGTNGYTYTISTTTLAQIGDSDFPNGAKTCCWLDGQFVVDDGSTDVFQISPDGSAWDALDFATAESAPDGLVRVFSDNGEIVLFGDSTTEFWGNVGASDFPFQAIKGASKEVGLAARWSLTKFNSGLAALMKNKQGQVQVMIINGYVPLPISSQEIDSIINSYVVVSDATAYAYMLGGHPMLQINFPGAGKSWLFDASTNLWSPLEYGLAGERHRGEMHLDFIKQALISDFENGNVYELRTDTYTDNSEPIARELISKNLVKGGDPITVDELYIDMETGVGLVTGQGSDPQAMLQTSVDGGRTWGNEMWKSMGAIGKYLSRVNWRRLGSALTWAFKVRITDPVKVVITYSALRIR